MANKKIYIMTVKNKRSGSSWEEQIEHIWVKKNSPHFETHEIGMHKAPNNLSLNQAEHYGRNLVDYFNSTLHEGEAPRELVSVRLKTEQE